MNQSNTQTKSFYGLGIAPGILQILDKLQYIIPTPIQHHAIPVAIEGKDVVGIAQTGTGKTLAFGIPMIQRIAQTKGRGLVILPTRELAMQVDEVLRKIGTPMGLRTAVLIGGVAIRSQLNSLAKNPHIIIATPGRLNDHLEQRTVNLHGVSILVLDEADRMLDMGFLPQIQRILASVPKERQTMLFSATLAPAIMKIAATTMKLPIRLEIAPSGTTADNIAQEIFVVKKEEKLRLLEKILQEYKGSTLVFMRTKHGAKRINRAVRAMGHSVSELHSNRSLSQRREALAGFKSGQYRILIATDIAARGLDVTGIETVVNYDLPANAEDYVHRIGRTGRAGAEGRAISFAMPGERYEVRSIERLIRKNLTVSPLPELPPERPQPAYFSEQPRYPERPRPYRGPRYSHRRR